MSALLQLRDVTRTYHMGAFDLHALRGVNVAFDEGEMVAIVGASGSGKSTLMHILGCLDRPSSGRYFIDGQDVSLLDDDTLSEIRNRKIGFVFQAFNLVPHLSIIENVEIPLFYMGTRRRERHRLCMEAVDVVGLGERRTHSPNELSGGERQRVGIARAIVHSPRVILADEPTGNLDSRTGSEILAVFHNLHALGRTVVVVTHDSAIAESLPRRVTVKDGAIWQDARSAA